MTPARARRRAFPASSIRAAAALALLAALPACKDLSDPVAPGAPGPAAPGGASDGPSRIVVEITGFEFRAPGGGSTIQATVGDTIEFVNLDAAPHTATSTAAPAGGAPFDTGRLDQNGRFSLVVTAAGTWSFRCDFHPAMTGTLVVAAGSAPPATPPATPPSAPPATPPSTPPGSPPATPPSGGTVLVQITDVFRGPGGTSRVDAVVGQTIEFVNIDDSSHTATSTGGAMAFDSGTMRQNARFSVVASAAGTTTFRCDFHSDMTGTIVVSQPGASPPPAPPGAPPAAGGDDDDDDSGHGRHGHDDDDEDEDDDDDDDEYDDRSGSNRGRG